ncbi:hypothetical protein PRBEI_2000560000 [Prionailurus iriomotensis]
MMVDPTYGWKNESAAKYLNEVLLSAFSELAALLSRGETPGKCGKWHPAEPSCTGTHTPQTSHRSPRMSGIHPHLMLQLASGFRGPSSYHFTVIHKLRLFPRHFQEHQRAFK